MKIFVILMTFCFAGNSLLAQSVTGTTVYNKIQQSSVMYELPYSESVLMDAMELKMKSYRQQPKKSKGFYIYKSVVVPEISSKPINLYFSIDRKSKKDKENSIVSMLIADENDAFYVQNNNADIFQRGKDFLNSFSESTATAKYYQDVADQEKEVSKAEKKLQNLQDDEASMAKKLKQLQDKISANNQDIIKQVETVTAQKVKLTELKKQQPAE